MSTATYTATVTIMDPQLLATILLDAQRITQLEIKQTDAIARFTQKVFASSAQKQTLSDDDFAQWQGQSCSVLQSFTLLMLSGLRTGNASMTAEDLSTIIANIQDRDFERDDNNENGALTAAQIQGYQQTLATWQAHNAVSQLIEHIKELMAEFPMLITQDTTDDNELRRPYLFTLHRNTYFSFASYWQNQIELGNRLTARLATDLASSAHPQADILASLDSARQATSFGLPNRDIHFRQWLAAYVAVKSPFAVITGGPGTGKTTVCAMVMRALMDLNGFSASDMVLCAPTGRAKSRLKESFAKNLIGDSAANADLVTIEAKTVHNLLNIKPDGTSRFSASNPLPYKVIAVDESSMLDVVMFNMLLGAIAPSTKLILLGDKDQLPSVEPGAVLADLTEVFTEQGPPATATGDHQYPTLDDTALKQLQQNTDGIPAHVAAALAQEHPVGISNPCTNKVVFLTKSHRSPTVTSWWSNLIESSGTHQQQDFELAVHKDKTGGYSEMDRILSDWINAYNTEYNARAQAIKQGDVRAFNQLIEKRRLLTVTNNGLFGRRRVNDTCYQLFHDKQEPKKRAKHIAGTPIIVLSNQKVKSFELFNGDLGVVIESDNTVCFEINSQLVTLPLADIVNYDMAFAITVHKSQGSEFEHVTVMLPEKPNNLISQQLIYTGVTRVKAVEKDGVEINNLNYIDTFGFLRRQEDFPRKEQRTGLLKSILFDTAK